MFWHIDQTYSLLQSLIYKCWTVGFIKNSIKLFNRCSHTEHHLIRRSILQSLVHIKTYHCCCFLWNNQHIFYLQLNIIRSQYTHIQIGEKADCMFSCTISEVSLWLYWYIRWLVELCKSARTKNPGNDIFTWNHNSWFLTDVEQLTVHST